MSVSVVACAFFFVQGFTNIKTGSMETVNTPKAIGIAFINDKRLIVDLAYNDLVTSGIDVLFRSEDIKDGISQLSALKELPQICIIDLDFYDKNVLAQLQELRTLYPIIKLIGHSDIDAEKAVKSLLEMGFMGYLLIGSDVYDFKKAIEVVTNGGKYFSVGIAKFAQEYFINN
jgi:DNA-binding NarL/FixJ family response regulator